MKRILYILLCLLGIGCSDFLEYKDNDKIIPRELKHFDEQNENIEETAITYYFSVFSEYYLQNVV